MTSDSGLAALTTQGCTVNGRTVTYGTGGAGSAILLLHGFPQTHLAWRKVAPALATSHRVFCPDLPGYGASERLGDGPEAFDKSRLADHLVALMEHLGHTTFAVVGHDRGGLVAFRMALDHPDRVTHVAILDIIPSSDTWKSLQGQGGIFALHLFLLAQPARFPERLVGGNPELFFTSFFENWVKVADAIPPDLQAEYIASSSRPEVIGAICDDYRASAFIDPEQDGRDQESKTRLAMPTLAAWQDPVDAPIGFDPEAIWKSWAPDLDCRMLPCGHFLPEEAPEDSVEAIRALLDR